jgi:PAS domain S-box-containing protein
MKARESGSLLLDGKALGTLRKAVIDTVGVRFARGIFARAGFACGFEDALAARDRSGWSDDREWLSKWPVQPAGLAHPLAEPARLLPASKGKPGAVARIQGSPEAEQHRRYMEPAKEPCCWSLTGYAAGWATAVYGEKALAVELECAAKGDRGCAIEVRPASDWGKRAEELERELFEHDGRESLLERVENEREEAKGKEREARSMFHAVAESAADMVWIRDEAGHILEANSAFGERLGLPAEKLAGRAIYDLYYEERDRTTGRTFWDKVQSDGSAFMNATLRRKDGRPLEIEMRGSKITAGSRPAMLVIARELAAEALDARRALTLYQAFRQSNDVMFYCDPNGVILDVNDAFARVYGYSREEAIGQTPRLIRSPQTAKSFYEKMWAGLLDPKLGYWKGELINRTKSGRDLPVLLSITTVRGEDGRILGYVSNALDTSEQRTLLARVAQSEALAGVGEMAAVVAHEIRNPLGSVVMAAKQLAEGGLSKDDRELVLRVLKDEGARLNQTLTNFLSYARPRNPQLRLADLNELVSEVVAGAKSNVDLVRGVKLKVKLDSKLSPFPFDSEMIRQVVWNLALNALQALDGKGTLSVETGRKDGCAFLKMTDTGPGIGAADPAEIFKPFFTTKRQGTGLGLAIADRIVKAHGGRIELETKPGKGAAFTMLLPHAENE